MCPTFCYHLPSAALPHNSEPAMRCFQGGAGRAQLPAPGKTSPKVWLASFPIDPHSSQSSTRGQPSAQPRKGRGKGWLGLNLGSLLGKKRNQAPALQPDEPLGESYAAVQLGYRLEFLLGIWHESYFFWTACCGQKQHLLPSLPRQLQREDGQSKSASVFRGQLSCWTHAIACPGRGKNPSQVRSDTLSWSGLASHIRVGERESRGEQPEQATLQPGEEAEGEVTYRKKNVCYLSFKARDTGRHFSYPQMILS